MTYLVWPIHANFGSFSVTAESYSFVSFEAKGEVLERGFEFYDGEGTVVAYFPAHGIIGIGVQR